MLSIHFLGNFGIHKGGLGIDLWTVVKYQSQQNIFELSNLGSLQDWQSGFYISVGSNLVQAFGLWDF